jgi:hypothetical protein
VATAEEDRLSFRRNLHTSFLRQPAIGRFKLDPNDPEWKKKATDKIIMKLIDKLST